MLSFLQTFLYKFPLLIIAFFIIYLFVFKGAGKNKLWYLLLITLLTFLIKLPYFFLDEINPDEGEWITIIRIWNAKFNPYINSDPHTSGIIALIPLYLFDKLIRLQYTTLRLLGTIFDLLTIYLTYKILSSYLNQKKKILFISLVVLYCMLNVSIEADFISYNTEHLCILVFVALVYTLNKMGILFTREVKSEKSRQYFILLFIAGLLVGSSLFIKLQNLPLFFLVFCFVCFRFLYNKNYKELLLFISFCFLPVIIIITTLYVKGLLNDFYTRYLLTNMDYTTKGLNFAFVDINRYGPFQFNRRNLYPFLTIVLLIFLLTITNIRNLKKAVFNQTFCFFVLALLVTTYEIVQPQNYFQHYYLLLYQPLILLFICFKNFELKKGILFTTLAFQFLFFWHFRKNDEYLSSDYNGTSEKILYNRITDDIRLKAGLNHCDQKYILEWGWNSRYFVYGNFIPVNRDFVNVHLFTHQGFLGDYYLHSFITDVKSINVKRILVIDDFQRQRRFKLYKFPEFIQHYSLAKNFRSITMIEHTDLYDTYVIELF